MDPLANNCRHGIHNNMDLIDGMRTYVAVVEAGSFTAAADRLGISKKLVSKYVGQLEEHVNARLLHRTTRRLSLTETGQQYYNGCLDLLASLDALESGLQSQHVGLAGPLRIAAPANFGEQFAVAAIAAFQLAHPDIIIDLQLNDRYIDLAAEGFDLAIRIGSFEDSALITRRIGQAALWTVAAPELINRLGSPSTPEDLQRFPGLIDTNSRTGNVWRYGRDGNTRSLRVTPRFRVNSAIAIRTLAEAGHGVGRCLDLFAAQSVADGRLVRLLPEYETDRVDIRVAYLSSSRMPARNRRFIDFLVDWFRDTAT